MSNVSYRDTLIGVVRDLASAERQRKYQESLPGILASAELRCAWFDDLYHPSSQLFQDSFSVAERAALADLNAVFSEAAPALPPDEAGLGEYLKSPAAQKIEVAARAVLLKCGWVAHDR